MASRKLTLNVRPMTLLGIIILLLAASSDYAVAFWPFSCVERLDFCAIGNECCEGLYCSVWGPSFGTCCTSTEISGGFGWCIPNPLLQ
ncbi:unnamed protein product [Amaranthus hypochondriacus]